MSRPTLIVGLGNPGPQYARTRHNIGFDLVDELARRWQAPLSENRKFNGLFAEAAVPGLGKLRLLKPLTYMNRSGQSIRAVLDWYKLAPEQLLVCYDDMDLPLGRIRLRLSGSAGTHNGMRSTLSHLNSQAFPRLRLGIGVPRGKGGDRHDDTVSHVLGKFAPAEQPLVEEVLRLAADAVEVATKEGVETAMNRFNARSLGEPVA